MSAKCKTESRLTYREADRHLCEKETFTSLLFNCFYSSSETLKRPQTHRAANLANTLNLLVLQALCFHFGSVTTTTGKRETEDVLNLYF